MKNDLDAKMQERLDKWRANPLPVKSLIALQKKGVFVSRKQSNQDLDDEEYLERQRDFNNKIVKGLT